MANTVRVHKKGNEWIVKRDEVSRGRFFTNQKDAYSYARNLALNKGITITLHSPDGKIKKVIHPQENLDEDDCFITTACVRQYNLPDDCYQLQTLRSFRDNYLKNQSDGTELIHIYYLFAPYLVQLINEHPLKVDFYQKIFLHINTACAHIERQEYSEAKNLYIKFISDLFNYFHLS